MKKIMKIAKIFTTLSRAASAGLSLCGAAISLYIVVQQGLPYLSYGT